MNETIDVMECMYNKTVQPRSTIESCQKELKNKLFELVHTYYYSIIIIILHKNNYIIVLQPFENAT